MTKQVEFTIVPVQPGWNNRGRFVSAEVMLELANRWPQFVKFGQSRIRAFEVKTDESDPAYGEIVEFLRRIGREPYLQRRPPLVVREDLWATHYEVKRTRVFEPEDFEGIEYFRLSPRWWLGEGKIGKDGIARVKRLSMTDVALGALLGKDILLLIDSLYHEIRREKFEGLELREAMVVDDDYEELGVEPPAGPLPVIWQLATNRDAPPVSNPLDSTDGQPYDATRHDWCDLQDDYYPPELRFRGADVEKIKPFDFAKLREPLPGPQTIVSRRFFEWCETRKLKIEWHSIVLE